MSTRGCKVPHEVSAGNGKALRVKCDDRQVTLRKWEEQLIGARKESGSILIHNIEAWWGRGRGQMDFYLIQIMLPWHIQLVMLKSENFSYRKQSILFGFYR